MAEPPELKPHDLIFSCHVCQDSLHEIYKELDHNEGLRDGPDSSQGRVIKLWLTECAHLTCGKHLENGGAPFHPAGQQPRAPCPVCLADKGDRETKLLYGIRGVNEGSYDKNIPRSYFEVPPVHLESTGHESMALRFQYLGLYRYGSKVNEKLQRQTRELHELRKQLDEEEMRTAEKAQEIRMLEESAFQLEKAAQKLKNWEKREPAIKHYLSILQPLARENSTLRQQLRYLGHAVPNTQYAMKLGNERDLLDPPKKAPHLVGAGIEIGATESSGAEETYFTQEQWEPRRAKRSDAGIKSVADDARSPGIKRKYEGSDKERRIGINSSVHPRQRFERDSSKEMMPPPPLPIARRSRKVQAHGEPDDATQTFPRRDGMESVVLLEEAAAPQVYDDRNWPSTPLPFYQTEELPKSRSVVERSTYQEVPQEPAAFRTPETHISEHHPQRISRGVHTPFRLPRQEFNVPDPTQIAVQQIPFESRALATALSKQDGPSLWSNAMHSNPSMSHTREDSPYHHDHFQGRIEASPSRHRISLPPAATNFGNSSRNGSADGLLRSNVSTSRPLQQLRDAPRSSLPHRQTLSAVTREAQNGDTRSQHIHQRRASSVAEGINSYARSTPVVSRNSENSGLGDGRHDFGRRPSHDESVTSPFFRSSDRLETGLSVRDLQRQSTSKHKSTQQWNMMSGPPAQGQSRNRPSLTSDSQIGPSTSQYVHGTQHHDFSPRATGTASNFFRRSLGTQPQSHPEAFSRPASINSPSSYSHKIVRPQRGNIEPRNLATVGSLSHPIFVPDNDQAILPSREDRAPGRRHANHFQTHLHQLDSMNSQSSHEDFRQRLQDEKFRSTTGGGGGPVLRRGDYDPPEGTLIFAGRRSVKR
ncbi:MAG: hypothetical protein M1819_007051 [Sarea resinae]|nr:MAG: hypothetical protein M1819_007051 [Sarea resinae]